MVVAKRSTCFRAQVGATIWKDSRLISTGYNGAPRGLDHCNKETCNDNKACENTIHAETNAICNASYFGMPTNGCTIVVTLFPCKKCAGQIINAGIKKIKYIEEYRDMSAKELFVKAGIKVERIS